MIQKDKIQFKQKEINKNFIDNLPYNPDLKMRARVLRKAGNLSEVLFWKTVRNKGFHELDFDRQKIIGNYIVDFYVKSLGLVIEIDGYSHDFKQEKDNKRQSYIESFGIKFFRVSDIDVKFNLMVVLQDLENFILENYS